MSFNARAIRCLINSEFSSKVYRIEFLWIIIYYISLEEGVVDCKIYADYVILSRFFGSEVKGT